MKIRKAKSKDFKRIAQIFKTEFGRHPYNEKGSIEAIIKTVKFYEKRSTIKVVEIDKLIVGVIVYAMILSWDGPIMIVEELAVDNKFKRQGVGKLLMKSLEEENKKQRIKSISFFTHEKSSAIKFYKKLGYKKIKGIISMRKKFK